MTNEDTTTTTIDAASGRVTFRPIPLPALVAVGMLAIGISPIAFLGGPWFLVLLVPVALAWVVIRTRTVVDDTSLRVLTLGGSRRIPWDDVETLRVADRGWVRAVRGGAARSGAGAAAPEAGDREEPALVGVRARHLGRVAQASGGRITMPTPEEVEEAREHERELEAARMRITALRERQAATAQVAEDAPAEGADERA
ncbi:PH domain-containing protein [Actinomycetospora sp. C-140]